ncbi:MAG: radical SAM protein [Peptococcaceae bacterium]|jgi:oxygen-independent coproporphyrinogen-3 oxidase|nr:radical SAM protein [Peptococcaceae bacterium]
MGFFTTATRSWLTRSTQPFTFTCNFDQALDYQSIHSLGLYVHIPFCKQICSFCPYCKQLYNCETAGYYVDALLREVHLVCAKQSGPKDVTSLYFGGGSPALLADDLGRIISTLQAYFNITDGIGVELNPENVTVQTLQKLKTVGVTRISIGVQSFNEQTLQKLGRRHFHCADVFQAIQSVSFDTVAMDFIFALEGQSFASVKLDIDTAFANGANHIALYPLIDFAFAPSGIKQMAKLQMKALLSEITAYCASRGYIRDSIWTFGKPGVAKYSSMTRDHFLGFGCSATTLLTGQFKINTFSLKAYADRINSGRLPTALTIHFTRRQRMLYWLFWRFYTTLVQPQDFENAFGVSLGNLFGVELWLGRLFGLLKMEGSAYRLTSRGVYYYHYLEGFYTLSYIDRMWNIMRQQPFPAELTL